MQKKNNNHTIHRYVQLTLNINSYIHYNDKIKEKNTVYTLVSHEKMLKSNWKQFSLYTNYRHV